ncbi:unnamed protein product [Anisakis simplex]|uniref:Uncharacterized protein n=1 Tax=Anisakis simplex TaxID=6269 RepID=A0A3P6RZV7_ANISI|nr:unnamed protein product [Anisakis simplex]
MVRYEPKLSDLVPSLPFAPVPPPPPPPIWYSPMPFPQPVPMFMAPQLCVPYSKYPHLTPARKQKTKKKQEHSACAQICCGGIAQLLWTIISIVLMGMIAALILALIVI